MNDVWALRSFRWIYVAFIVYSSAQTLVQSHAQHLAGHVTTLVPALAVVEIAAALLFLVEPAEALACIALIGVYVVAAALTISLGEVPLRFLYYAATACYILFTHRRQASERRAIRHFARENPNKIRR